MMETRILRRIDKLEITSMKRGDLSNHNNQYKPTVVTGNTVDGQW